MPYLPWGKLGGRHEWRSRDGRSEKRTVGNERMQNHSIAVPSRAGRHSRSRDRLHETTLEIDPLDPAVREEPDRPTVGGPEGKRRILGSEARTSHLRDSLSAGIVRRPK